MEKYNIHELKIDNFDERFPFWNFINEYRKRELVLEIENNKRRMFVCEINNEYVGGLSITNEVESQLYISYFIVREDFQNRGIGGSLIDFVFQYAETCGINEILIGVYSDNLGAKRLYKRKGFVEIHEADNKITLLKKL